MATPHLAGSAAVVIQQHDGWSAAQVRSAIVNSAEQGLLKKYTNGTSLENDVNVIGAGRDDLAAALAASVALEPVSVSFGAVPSGSGQSRSFAVTVTNLTAAQQTVSLTVVPATSRGVSFTVTPSLTIAGSASETAVVKMTAAKGAAFGDHQATLFVTSGVNQLAHAAVYTLVK